MRIILLSCILLSAMLFAEDEKPVKPPAPPPDDQPARTIKDDEPKEVRKPAHKKPAPKQETESALDMKALYKEGDKERKERIADLKKKIDAGRVPFKGLIDPRTPVSMYEKKLAEYEAEKKFLPTLKLEEGSIGIFRDTEVSKKSGGFMNAQTGRVGSGSTFSWGGGSVEVVQVIDGKNMLVNWKEKETIWVAGVDTTGLVDGKITRLDGIFRYSGTKQYSTAAGASRTVYLIEEAKP
ncbi:MAG TPA: hypothetical protein VGP72_27025 [Planctomycetota bacterium]|jgi:anti-sigma28 factor (negative regulator of flagellin synthesis)